MSHAEVIMPLVFAVILALLLQPALRLFERLRIPRTLASLLLISALLGTIVGLGTPFQAWHTAGRASFQTAFRAFRRS